MNLTKLIGHRFDPEWIHNQAVRLGAFAGRANAAEWILDKLFGFEDDRLTVRLGNLTFPNPIGLAAGFDKDGVMVPVLQALGFGFIEVGTVTPIPQVGNPKPRLFRLKADQALINRMGFNNKGVDALTASLAGINKRVPVGVNLGKNKTTPLNQAASDYIKGIQKAWQVADYFSINISSPNTADLRDLQGEQFLKPLVDTIRSERNRQARITGQTKQIWLKIAPDLNDSELEMICDTVLNSEIDALVVSNTTTERSMLHEQWRNQTGGLSGKPLFEIANEVLKKANRLLKGNVPLVGVGGIYSAADAKTKLSLGASLVQVYTSFVMEGPGIVKKLKRGLLAS